MDAKFWSEEYNKANPPKKIDIMQMMIVELVDRPDSPLYHVESVIGGFTLPRVHVTVIYENYTHSFFNFWSNEYGHRWAQACLPPPSQYMFSQ